MASTLAQLLGRKGRQDPATATATKRTTRNGAMVGIIAPNGAHVWRGIRYGASTAGANRWRAPQPVPSWAGTRPVVNFAPRCAQLTNVGDRDEGVKPGLVVGTEDCLALDIYAPPTAQGESLPVMVWIHGGGNVWGRSSLYDGSELAMTQDVIVITVQYRLGPLGWFSHPGLRAQAETADDKAACFATLDLIASLEWVAANISAFGGDPDCVTIFGESSGGHNVATLLGSPLAEGLFHRAIIQSGSFDSVTVAEAEGTEGSLLNPSGQIVERLGAENAEDLRNATVQELYGACDTGSGWFLDVPRVIQDGVVLPEAPLREAFASALTFNAVPIITGTNKDEMKLFFGSDPTMIEKKFGVLPVPRDRDFYDAKARYVSRVWRARAVDEPAAEMATGGHSAVYAYRFDWDDGGRFLMMDFKQLFGAAHGFEVPFVFHRFVHLGDADRFLFQKRTGPERDELSRAMGTYWASFARDGKPSCAGQPNWPHYDHPDGSVLLLDSATDGGIRVVQDPDSVRSIVRDLQADSSLSKAQRRAIADEMAEWMFTKPVESDFASAVGK